MSEIKDFKSEKRLKSLDEFNQEPFKVIPDRRIGLTDLQIVLIGLVVGGLIGCGLYEIW